ncbi:hypothetical protein WDW37_03140 [Bdellovibrionota bacterium FG-1]
MKTKNMPLTGSLFGLALTLLTLSSSPSSFAGGTSSGGGGTEATLFGMLPKSISYRVQVNFNIPEEYIHNRPLVEKSWCSLAMCYHAPDQMIFDTLIQLVGGPDGFLYAVEGYQAMYLLDGKWKKLPLNLKHWQPEIFTLGTQHIYDDGNKKEIKPGWSFAPRDSRAFIQEMGIPNGFRPKETWVIDGVLQDEKSETILERMVRIRKTIENQTDYNSPSAARRAISQLNQLGREFKTLQMFLPVEQDRSKPFDELGMPELHFHEVMKADAADLLSFGQSAIASDGTCDLNKYTQLLNRLRTWIIGSPAYFYHLEQNSEPTFTSGEKMAALGLRQNLKLELTRLVAPYCEPQSANHTSQVDLLLND